MQRRQVRTVQPVRETGDSTVLVRFLGGCRHARRCATTGAGVQSVQAALESHSCSALAVGTAAVEREEGGEGREGGKAVCRCLQAGEEGVHHTGACMHRHVVVDIHALVVDTLPEFYYVLWSRTSRFTPQDRVLVRFVEQNFKTFQQDRAPQRLVEQNIKLIVAFPKDTAPQRLVEHSTALSKDSAPQCLVGHIMDFSRDRAHQHLVELNIFIIFLLFLLMDRAVVLMARQSSGPCVSACSSVLVCFKGNECTFAYAWEELHPDSPEWGL